MGASIWVEIRRRVVALVRRFRSALSFGQQKTSTASPRPSTPLLDNPWQKRTLFSMDGLVHFIVSGDLNFALNKPDTFVGMYEQDALDLLEWLGYPRVNFGSLDPSELRARCMRRLWDVPRNHDPQVTRPNPIVSPFPEWMSAAPQKKLIIRPAGFLRARTAELLALSERFPDRPIMYS